MQKTNVSTPVTQDELNVVGGIEVFVELSIASIEGVQYLNNLRYLYMDNNQVSDLTPISGFTNLGILYLDNNQISDLTPISSFTNLSILHLNNNQIS
ncbi:leucine-rich repeat domain-containing protein, partial [Listeria innocua]|uniref:leucine-rich repeat domain-containing protein n=1 Tax=Listeria innocua TaxID=1642 RepID=UPI0035DDCA28